MRELHRRWRRQRLLADQRRLAGVLALLLVSATSGCSSEAQATRSASAAARPAEPSPCLAKAPSRVAANTWAPALKVLAPAGASAIRLCGYDGLNARPRFKLAASALIRNRRLVGELVSEFDALPSLRPGVFACPDDDGSEIIVLLAYPDGHEVTISASVTGCSVVSNGDVARSADYGPPGPHLMAQLERLNGYHRDI
jgi:hypothetical protein